MIEGTSLFAEIRFTGILSPLLAMVVLVITLLGVGWYYLRETRHLASPYSFLLPALRAVAIALTIIVLTGPVWHREKVIGTLGRVVFAVDTSKSMSIRDSEDARQNNRLDRAIDFLTSDDLMDPSLDSEPSAGQRSNDSFPLGGAIKALSETHEIDVVTFDVGRPRVLWSSTQQSKDFDSLDFRADGRNTDIGSVLSMVSSTRSQDGNPDRTAWVILSDGQSNSGRAQLSAIAAGSKTVVHAIGFGSPDEPNDMGIVQVNHPQSVPNDGRLAGEIQIKRSNANQAVVVQIESADGTVVDRIPVDPKDSDRVAFDFDVRDVPDENSGDGIQRSSRILDLKARIIAADVSTDKDVIQENDVAEFRVSATTRKRNLLILDGSSRWETRYLRNLFDRDPSWTVDTITVGPGTDTYNLIRGERRGEFPGSELSMARYDAVILGEIPETMLKKSDVKLLEDFVSKGGGLIFIDGQYGSLTKMLSTSLANLSPVEPLGRVVREIKSLTPTEDGMSLPMLNLNGDGKVMGQLWREMPHPKRATVVEAKLGTDTWLEVTSEEGESSPWFATRLFGSGRVAYFAGDQSWLWRYKVADRFHARFWNQVVTTVMQPPYAVADDFVAIATDKLQYSPDKSPEIRVRLRGANGEAVGDATVDALLLKDGQVVSSVPLASDDPNRGTYRGISPPLPLGKYEVRVRASGFDTRALRASTPIWVGRDSLGEWARLSMDGPRLDSIAKSTGGVFRPESSADEVLEKLKPLSDGRLIQSDTSLWESYGWLFSILGLLTAEWWLRKRASLV